MSFGARARAAMAAYGPLCVGIDPHAALLDAWGLEDNPDGLQRFADICVEALAGNVAFVKPQSAFFERHGAAGVAVLERTIAGIRDTGTLVILDAKRGDIGSTAAAYAQAYLDVDSPMAADALTVSPYLGFGSLQPFFKEAERNDAGVFVLGLTSNPEGHEVQHARTGTGSGTVAGDILSQLAVMNADAQPMGAFGAVVGATIGQTDESLDINGPILAPGFGAQGGTLDDIARIFAGQLPNVIPATSRAVLVEGPDVPALLAAVMATNGALR